MFETLKCPKCGRTTFEVYHSLDLLVCSHCKAEYTMSKVQDDNLKIQHQRG